MGRRSAGLLLLLVTLSRPASGHFLEDQIFVADRATNVVYFVNRANWTWTQAIDPTAGYLRAGALCFNGQGLLLLGDPAGDQVLEFQPTMRGAPVLDRDDGLQAPAGAMAVDGDGWVYVLSPRRRTIWKTRRDYRYTLEFADAHDGLLDPRGVTVRADGSVLVADGVSGRLVAFDAQGNGVLFDHLPGEDVRSLAIGANRDLFVACQGGNLYRYPGGAPSGRVLFGSYGSGTPSIQFDFDYQTLVHVNRGDGFLRTIDPVTGADVVRVQAGWDPVGLAVMGSQSPPGSFTAYGPWVTGARGFAPDLQGAGNPRPGGNVILHLHDFVGGAPAILVTGVAKDRAPLFGGYLLVDVNQWHQFTSLLLWGRHGAPGEGQSIQGFRVPPDPALALGTLYAQALAADPLARQGVSMTGGLRIWLGD